MLLLDEPFGALDAKVRKELRDWLRRLHDEVHVTTVFVTHDQEEALEVADQIVVINNGRIEQVGTPDELYDRAGDRVRDELPRPGDHAATGQLVRPHDIEIEHHPVRRRLRRPDPPRSPGSASRCGSRSRSRDRRGHAPVQVTLTRAEAGRLGVDAEAEVWIRHAPDAPATDPAPVDDERLVAVGA